MYLLIVEKINKTISEIDRTLKSRYSLVKQECINEKGRWPRSGMSRYVHAVKLWLYRIA